MTMQNRLAALEKRRDTLKREIEECEAHPSVDQLKIAELKRIKLQIKDEIARLSSLPPQAAAEGARI
mgnify:CR=1 FL=1